MKTKGQFILFETLAEFAHFLENPQERAQANLSVVGSCSVTDCRFNEEHECHAGQIEVRVGPDGAHCGTYQPEASLRPRP